MASPTSKTDIAADWQGRVIAHDDLVSRLSVRREELGEPDMPRNAGNRRSTSKRALLEALHQLGADW
ncbi:hypothetical protein KZ820_11835 [Sphingomonas sp. RRHST34]|uniref:Uncharacterized protein n=1 Tax=Sphingomonas citri TaxID=2862499 RepID=A0ABS7BPI0_9SPHN|nr:hypothetical protein [Sphingomonas citri]MBW6531425.1 hypothetical protein [Sphingomonas citri]